MVLNEGLLALGKAEHNLFESLHGSLPSIVFRHDGSDRASWTKLV